MNQLAPGELLKAFDSAPEVSSRWPQLKIALGLHGHPSPAALNDALQALGFGGVDERASPVTLNGPAYPGVRWFAIARDVTGHEDATVDEVVTKLGAATPAY